jgi:DNA-binding GntR family transcriptional regulator
MQIPFKVETNAAQVASIIRRLITSGELKPGMRLPEVELSKSLGVSRSPIRESFRILEAEGLVQVTPNKGVSVSNFSGKDIVEIYELRTLLESYGIRHACKYLSQENLEELKALIIEMGKKVEAKDFIGYLNAANKFHELFMENCNNLRLFNLFKALRNNILTIQAFSQSYPEHGSASFEEHKKIFEALLKRDEDRAEAHLKKHLISGLARTKKYLGIKGI